MPQERWVGYIKDYDGGTLMECFASTAVNYLNVPAMLKAQRERILSSLAPTAKGGVVHPGLTDFHAMDSSTQLTADMLPKGTLEAGWKLEELAKEVGSGGGGGVGGGVGGAAGGPGAGRAGGGAAGNSALREALQRLTSGLVAVEDLHFFRQPVDLVAIPDYIKICPLPMGKCVVGALFFVRAPFCLCLYLPTPVYLPPPSPPLHHPTLCRLFQDCPEGGCRGVQQCQGVAGGRGVDCGQLQDLQPTHQCPLRRRQETGGARGEAAGKGGCHLCRSRQCQCLVERERERGSV